MNADLFAYEYSLVFVVAVITTGSRTIEGAVQAGIGFSVIQLLLTLYLPARFVGIEPILFAFGALTYAVAPRGHRRVPEEPVDGAGEQAVQPSTTRDEPARPGRPLAGPAGPDGGLSRSAPRA